MAREPFRPTVPDWENIRYITSDLKEVLDNFKDDSSPIPVMKVRLARVIAQMRDEKGMEDRILKQMQSDPFYQVKMDVMKVRQKLMKLMEYK